MTTNEKIHEAMWQDFDAKNSFPNVRPLLAHYTSISVFEQMMSNDEVWFSNPLYMNDLEELRFGMVEGARAFRSSQQLQQAIKSGEHYKKLLFYFDSQFSEFETNHAFHSYIMCLSKHEESDKDGRLSMWRGYGAGGSGVAIVFDTSKIEANENSPLIVGPVRYASGEERLDWINTKVDALSKAIADTEQTDQELYEAAFHWIERLKIFALFTKHKGFHEEQEWRIVYMHERDKDNLFKSMHSYAITARGIEPKLKLRIEPIAGLFAQDLSFEKIVHRVILGPTNSGPLAQHALVRILESKSKAEMANKVCASSIPFRP